MFLGVAARVCLSVCLSSERKTTRASTGSCGARARREPTRERGLFARDSRENRGTRARLHIRTIQTVLLTTRSFFRHDSRERIVPKGVPCSFSAGDGRRRVARTPRRVSFKTRLSFASFARERLNSSSLLPKSPPSLQSRWREASLSAVASSACLSRAHPATLDRLRRRQYRGARGVVCEARVSRSRFRSLRFGNDRAVFWRAAVFAIRASRERIDRHPSRPRSRHSRGNSSNRDTAAFPAGGTPSGR